MSRLTTWALSQSALALLTQATAEQTTGIPADWFNWSFPAPSTATPEPVLRRLNAIPVVHSAEERTAWLLAWYHQALAAGCAPAIATTMADREPLPTALAELQVLCLADDASSRFLPSVMECLSRAEAPVCALWAAYRHWGPQPYSGPVPADARQMRCYANTLRTWFARPAVMHAMASVCADPSGWDVAHRGTLGPDAFLWPPPGTALGPGEHDAFVPLQQFPFCGISLDGYGQPCTVGLLSDGWEWDDGRVRQCIAAFPSVAVEASKALYGRLMRQLGAGTLASPARQSDAPHALHAADNWQIFDIALGDDIGSVRVMVDTIHDAVDIDPFLYEGDGTAYTLFFIDMARGTVAPWPSADQIGKPLSLRSEAVEVDRRFDWVSLTPVLAFNPHRSDA